jgi:hypothetical protein
LRYLELIVPFDAASIAIAFWKKFKISAFDLDRFCMQCYSMLWKIVKEVKRMNRKEAMKDSGIWQNIGEVAVQTGNLFLSVHSYAFLRRNLRFPDGVLTALLL